MMTDEEFENYKIKMTEEMLLEIKDAFPKEYAEYLARTTGPKRKLDI